MNGARYLSGLIVICNSILTHEAWVTSHPSLSTDKSCNCNKQANGICLPAKDVLLSSFHHGRQLKGSIMNELAESDYNLQTPKMLHEQQCGIYGFHFPSPNSMRVHTAINTLIHTHTHLHTTCTLSHNISCHLHGFFN